MTDNILKSFGRLAAPNTAVTGNNAHILEDENVSVDISMLYEISGNDKNFINRTIATFLKNMPDTINKIQLSLNNQNWEDVYLFAHLAKSSLSVIKIGEIFNWVVQIEENANNKTNLNSVSELLKKIKEKYLFAAGVLNKKLLPINDNFNNI